MKVAIIGGGPAGLYAAILLKKQRPEADVAVYERNRHDDTFGFGVVFSDATLDNFEKHDPPSYRRITQEFAYWDDIAVHFRGTVHRVGGNGFCGCSRRMLLLILQERARELGVKLFFEVDIADEAKFADADLVVIADGVNSRFREKFSEHFQPEVDLRSNKFTWMGSTKPLDAFTFVFQETEWGPFIAHAYQYEAGHSTWIFETDPETFARAGLTGLGEQESAHRMEAIFADYLDGHKLLINRSMWRNFPMIRNQRWVRDNMVLLGDAKATAHFSIGSGTKLAMEDAIALAEAVQSAPTLEAALVKYEHGRREEVEKTQHAADVSLVWFEHVDRFWDFDPVQFAFGVMTRAKAITYDNLGLRAPDFVAEVDRVFARQVKARGFDVDTHKPVAPMFQPFRLRDMVLKNRAVMSPMCMYSAKDGVPQDFHLVHYGSRAIGGAGLIFTEMTCVAPEARITPGCTGLWNDEQEAMWRRIVDFVHGNSETKICLQLGHAGRKGATKLMWDGMDRPLEQGAWDIVSASPLPYFPDSQVPREIDRATMDRVRQQFVDAALRGDRCGFDMLELHCAHGYLLASFISPLTNTRTDAYGGSLDNRLRFPLEVFTAMRAAWPAHKPMSVRISATDWAEGGITGDDAVEIARAFREAGVDLVDVSTGQTVKESRPIYGRMFQTPFSDQVRNEADVATMCVGNITTADQINTILAAGRADLVALGRPHLVDPGFTIKAAAWYGAADAYCPPPYLPGKDQIFRNSVRDRQDFEDLKIKGKPKTRAELKADAAKSLAAE
ncbi:bifunctional salicylyl-CoA 5-hydroxylase/oxidoreductase [Bradyrhizobium sp. U87765 SZCCT0131]|uniref:bifunctional salicylyl-CoA 5-hydroxylase/oxidoreductase n=1 Tax=unclassified Bradyrhizobium TaxID=2631580 RepID=UPI001BAB76B3|nr:MULTISPECIES: bifunctional salicylyl-CoA 5-hydroxylase/oxidoreductase [unclassified Bradyrhizobium]MBR1219568.1 bifunctional salicylyl-CoA 5-hydroxylase/oxidoreductase [Bradyrhizobium sp. U87765 SZCCT0131]MBR1262219.1 bifunctional salicylyl-CoA 5-hydroxylase/oxidoreductase [Bradyrhizobium sp. U87765 SZCCT0134]MBR1308598.1 bifunctional salicylyl-CoA 5-hydroxylase/oxidoreductase [Bradyrhizobium sp. U87765 SZCCT0110]MBR1318001.1 bifunctional salicylyl-CoA 5-hydroxylase/oxidoreductase [Bradyrhiz